MYKGLVLISLVLLFILGGVLGAAVNLTDVSIDAGATYATSTTVSVSYTVTPTDSNVCISETLGGCVPTQNLSSPQSFILSAGDGTKTVYVRANYDGNIIDANDTIILDTTAPTLSNNPAIPAGWQDGNVLLTSISCNDINSRIYINETNTDVNSLTNYNFEDDANYYIYCQDPAGNKSTPKSVLIDDVNGVIDSITPSDGSWTNADISVVITASNAGSGIDSCYYKLGDAAWQTGTSFPLTATTTVQIYCTDNMDRNTATQTKNYNIDKTNPGIPGNLTVSDVGDGYVTLSWDATTDTGGSGLYRYDVFMNGSHKAYSSGTATNVTVSGLTNGTSYNFKVKAVDNASNESSFTSELNATPQSTSSSVTVRRSGTEVTYVKDGDELEVTCSWGEETDNARIRYRYYDTSWGTTTTLGTETDNTTLLIETINVASGYTRINFWCESNGTATSTEKTIYIDNELPTVEWKDTNTNMKGIQRIKVTAEDNKGIDLVEFEFNGVKYGSTKSGNDYYYDLDTKDSSNGNQTLKAIVKDLAGNEKTITKTVTIQNELNEEQEAQEAISTAEAKKVLVEDLIHYYNNNGLQFDSVLLADKNNADALLAEAKNLLTQNDYNNAKAKADQAKTLYTTVNEDAVLLTTNSQEYVYSADNLEAQLQSLGFSEEQIALATQKIIDGEATRKLSIIKVGNEYQVQIELTFTLDTNKNNYKIVEIIPKELIESASMLYSNLDFSIVQDDPIVEFVVPNDTTKIFYSFKVSEERANEIIDNNVISNFSVPPVILEEDDKIVLAPINIDLNVLGIITIIIVVVVILGLIGAAVFMQKKTGGSGRKGFSHSEKDNAMSKLKSAFKKDSNGKKWKYKG